MAKIAVDVVVLPSEEMMDKAVEANGELLKTSAGKIILDKESCLPHISLAMGCIDERDIAEIEEILRTIAKRYSFKQLTVTGIDVGVNAVGEKVSVFSVEKTKTLQSLHKEVMEKLGPYFSYDASSDMMFSYPEVEQSTLLWIKNYPEKSSFENFAPHITIGFGEINNFSFPIKFTASKLALCHLGNHCTCREILTSTVLRST